MSEIIYLQRDVIFNMLNLLDINSLSKICASSTNLRNICQNYDFWNRKYISEFAQSLPRSIGETNYIKVYFENRLNILKEKLVTYSDKLWNKIDKDIINAFQNEYNIDIDTLLYDIKERLAIEIFNIDFGSESDWIDPLIQWIINYQITVNTEDKIDNIIIVALVDAASFNFANNYPAGDLVELIINDIRNFQLENSQHVADILETKKYLDRIKI